MRKKCYSLTYLGSNVNGGSDFRINAQIWLRPQAGSGAILNNLELIGYCNYLQSELRRVWSTATNPGLSSGNGPYAYNGTNDTFTCMPPTGSPAHNRDTGIVVSPIAGRTPHVILPNIRKRQNEIIFDLFRDRPPNRRAFIDPEKQEGELYYYQQPPAPLLPGAPIPPFIPYNENGLDVRLNSFYSDVHNTAAHEFGHALGLMDRYHYLAFAHHTNSNASLNISGSNKSRNWIVRHAGGDVPMYLPGFYDRNLADYDNSFTENPPPYDQEPYETGSPVPNNAGEGSPQPDFNLNYPGHRQAYDLDYTSRFGWEHNIMSKRIGINDPNGLAINNRFNSQYAPAGINADPLYLSIYGAEIGAGLPEVVLITETQTKVITDTGGNTTSLPSVGGEIISKRFEDKRAADEGFPKGMFDQFIFMIGQGTTMSTFVGNQDRDAIERGIPTRDLEAIMNITGNVTDSNRSFYNTRSGGSFVGLLYSNELNQNGEGARIVCDWEFDQDLYGNTLGVSDCMDYRISTMDTSPTPKEFKWTPKLWTNDNGTATNKFYGFINPGIAAKKSPKSKSRSYLMGRINAGVVLKNIELTDLNNTLFFNILNNIYGASFPGYFQNGLSSINLRTLAFGTAEPLRLVQRILQQVINPTDTSIMNGKFKTTNGKFNFVVNDDIFANAGIATGKGRAIWNGFRNDRAPTLPNPGAIGTVSTPATIQQYNPNNLPTTYVFNNIAIVPWTFKPVSGGAVKYIISFSIAGGGTLPANFALLPRYEIIVRNYSNREIIETMALPS